MAAKQQRKDPNRRIKSDKILSQFGIEIPDVDMDEDGNLSDENDDDLENELEALLSGKVVNRRAPKAKAAPVTNVRDVERMAAECLKDSDNEETETSDSKLSDDEELLAELRSISSEHTTTASSNSRLPSSKIPGTVSPSHVSDQLSHISEQLSVTSLLEERLELYEKAVEASKLCGDNAKARRYGRAVKTLKEMLSSARQGRAINEEEIPPVVVIPKQKAPSAPATMDISSNKVPEATHASDASPKLPDKEKTFVDNLLSGEVSEATHTSDIPSKLPNVEDKETPVRLMLINGRNQYKKAALKAKLSGDTETALQYVKIAKKFDAVIAAEKEGMKIDLSSMPPPPPGFEEQSTSSKMIDASKKESEKIQTSVQSEMEVAALAAASESEAPDVFSAPPAPKTVLEALQQRLQKFCSTRDTAKAEGNSSKARRLNRIVQQYETAIKDYKSGKPVNFDELPTPPGFAPIPTDSTASTASAKDESSTVKPKVNLEKQNDSPKEKPSQSTSATAPSPTKNKKLHRANTSTVLEKQLAFLLERQKLFRQAALESKRNGDIQQAKEYLRMSKGFDSMIEATKCGLPIDATSIPTPPQLESDYVIVDESECMSDSTTGDKDDVFRNLEKELQKQIEMCSRNKDHFLCLGDVSSASKFEKLGLDTKKDLAVVQYQWKNGDPVPRFHYETRLFSMVQCNTDLSDSDLEVTVERGINLPGKPDDLDSYVRIELPIPSETPQRAKTHTVRDTNNPIFQEVFKFEINRKSRTQVRQFKRQMLKLEVWSKGGFFRSDTLLGIACVKLIDLESKCSIHDSFDLLMGRKACGGRLEVKIKIRDPLMAKQVEQVKEKWLVIGH